jgi:hypothetical protein
VNNFKSYDTTFPSDYGRNQYSWRMAKSSSDNLRHSRIYNPRRNNKERIPSRIALPPHRRQCSVHSSL